MIALCGLSADGHTEPCVGLTITIILIALVTVAASDFIQYSLIINSVNMNSIAIGKAIREPVICDRNRPVLPQNRGRTDIDTRQPQGRCARFILSAAGKHIVLVRMELRHCPDGWTGADETIREWCVENRHQLPHYIGRCN